MEKKRVVPAWVSMIILILVILSAAYYTYLLIFSGISGIFAVITSLNLLCDIAALIYCLTGYRKDSSFFFKSFIICLYAAIIVLLFSRKEVIASSSGSDGVAFWALVRFAMLSVFVFAKDIGRKRSLVYALVALASQIISTIISGANESRILFISSLAACAYYIVFVLMIYGKYKDKESRGSK